MERTALLESYCPAWVTHEAVLFEKEGVLTLRALVNNPYYDIISDPAISSLHKWFMIGKQTGKNGAPVLGPVAMKQCKTAMAHGAISIPYDMKAFSFSR